MTSDTPEALSAHTRRTSRRDSAVSASPVAPAQAPVVDISVETLPPAGSRRAARLAAQGAAAAAQAARPAAEAAAASEAPKAEADAAASSDLFAQAREAFSAQQVPEVPQAARPVDVSAAPAHLALAETGPRRARGTFVRKAAAAGSTLVVMGLTAALAVSMTLPSEAVAAAQGSTAPVATSLVIAAEPIDEADIQAFVSPETVADEAIERSGGEGFETMSMAELAAQQGISYSDSVYTNDPNAAIQWPFITGVPLTSRYGMRWGRMHEGIDMVPGAGAPIQAIADGVVRIASTNGGAYGVHVWIDHEIDGMAVGSHYAHMQYNSLNVTAGQEVKVGDIIGNVGNTGRSYGPHLHFEIELNGTKVDPLPFMLEYAGTY